MKKIVCILWHQIAPVVQSVLPEVEKIAEYIVYSARSIDQQKTPFEKVCRDLKEADFALLGTNSGDSIWPQIMDQVKKHQIFHGVVGNAGDIHDLRTLEVSAACDSYYAQGGKENYKNLLLLCAQYAGCEGIHPEPPKVVPWQGFFYPDEPGVFYPDARSYFSVHFKREKGTVALLTSRQNWNNGVLGTEALLVNLLEERGYTALPMYSYYMPDNTVGALGMTGACKELLFEEGMPIPDAVIKLSGTIFPKSCGDGSDIQQLLADLHCPVFRPILSTRTSIQQWQEDTDGTLKDIAWSVALPEMDGCIEPIYIGGIENDDEGADLLPVRSRCTKLVDRVVQWIKLQKKEAHNKKVVFMLNNNPCASVEATVGAGANLDTLESVARLLHLLKEQGYDIPNPPKDGKELVETIMQRKAISEFRWTTVEEIVNKGGCVHRLPTQEYKEWFSELPERARKAMIEGWGEPPGQQIGEVPPSMVYEDTICITGVQYGNALVCVQPKRGCAGSRCDGTVCRVLHDPHIPPTHQYYATYRFFEKKFGADYIVHVGTHGNLEFLPGRGSGLSDACFPDTCIGNLPNLYLYNADNPPEATVAKRRALATVVDHMQTTFVQSGLYDELEEIDQLIAQYKKLESVEPAQAKEVKEQILDLTRSGKLAQQVNPEKHLAHGGFDHLCKELHRLLSLVRNTQMQDGMHVFGEIPKGDRLVNMVYSILRYESGSEPGIRSCLCDLYGFDFSELLKQPQKYYLRAGMDGGKLIEIIEQAGREVVRCFLLDLTLDSSIDKSGQLPKPDSSKWDRVNELREKALDIRRRVEASDEMGQFAEVTKGRYIAPGPGGAITRGRYDVLPTGRNIYSLDPDVVPTKAAWVMGMRLADVVIEKFMNEEGRYPESFGIYWMCNDIMWADGEGMAQLMYMIGVRPVWQPNGKVLRFEVIPLEELGRPRIDINAHVSGILRDNFSSRMELLDEAIRCVAQLDEPEDQNYIKKHTKENLDNGMDIQSASTRIFGARPGTYLNGISLQVFASAWTDRKEMLDVYTFFNGYSYSKGNYGEEAYKALQNSLRTLDITYNKVVSDEHDLLTCSCYFGVQGGMTAAAEALSGKKVQTYYGDSREVYDVQVRTLTDELNRVVQTKLLNPVWIEGQKRHGYKGAGDISKRVGRVYGWEATTDAVGDWVFDEICRTFIQNQDNFDFFKVNNPWAMEEMQRRLVEAAQRGLWEPGEGIMESLQDSCLEIEGVLEETMGENGGNFQGNAIDVKGIDELNQMKQQLHRMKDALKD